MNMPRKTIITTLVVAFFGVAAAAEDNVQSVKVDELTFKTPASWKKETPKSPMRKAQIVIPAVKGDDEPAELLVFIFPGGAGGLEANIDRWEKQFVDADKRTPKAKIEKKKGINVDVTRVEISGRFVASVMPGAPGKNDKPNYRLLGAVVETKDAGYFLKLTGPEKTVADSTKAFDSLIESMKLDK